MSQAWSFSRSGEVDPFAEQQAHSLSSHEATSLLGMAASAPTKFTWRPLDNLTRLLPAAVLHSGTASFPQLLVLVALLWR